MRRAGRESRHFDVEAWVSRNPPAIEACLPGLCGVEADILEGDADGGRCACDDMRGMEDELPLALPEEQRDGEIDCAERCQHHDADAAEQPAACDQRIAWAQRVIEISRRCGTHACGHKGQPKASSSADSSGVPQTRQMTAEQSPQVSGSLTGRAHRGHQSEIGVESCACGCFSSGM